MSDEEKTKRKKARRAQPEPVWRMFMQNAHKAIVEKGGFTNLDQKSFVDAIAAQIYSAGDGPAFLRAVRRGKPTQRQELRYLLLREMERLCGDTVKRRRPDQNTPDSLALKKHVQTELEAYATAGGVGISLDTPRN